MKRYLIIAISALLFAACWGQGKAVDYAREFSNKHWPGKVQSIDCVDGFNADSDGNGYISCTVFFLDDRDPVPLECATNHTGCSASGCKIASTRR